MPLRTLTYQVRIWHRFRKMHRAAPLPPILVVLVSHVRGGWKLARTLLELFDPFVAANRHLAQQVPAVPLIIDDLARCSNDELQRRMLAPFPKLALWLLRDARDPGVCWAASVAGSTRSLRRSVDPMAVMRSPHC